MSKITFKEKLKENNYKIIMNNIKNEIKDIIINKFLSLIMIQDKEISFLKNQCEDFLKLTTKILKKNIITESTILKTYNKINKKDCLSKKSTLNSSNENLNNNSKLFNYQITSDFSYKEIKNKNRKKSENKELNLNTTKYNQKVKTNNYFSPLQRSESLNLLYSNLNENIIIPYSGSGKKNNTKKIIFDNNNNNIVTKSFSNNKILNNNILNKTTILKNPFEKKKSIQNSRNYILTENSKNDLCKSSIFENKHCKIIQKKIEYNKKAFSNNTFISHINNINNINKEKLKVNTSRSILNNSNFQNHLNVNNNNFYQDKSNIVNEKKEENKNSKLNSYLFKIGNF